FPARVRKIRRSSVPGNRSGGFDFASIVYRWKYGVFATALSSGSFRVYNKLAMPSERGIGSALDLLVLTILDRRGPLHGYGIAVAIGDLSEDALRIEEGSLYPALHRMEELGWISAEWKMSETKRRARFYRISKSGKNQLASESERWASFSAGVARVLRHA
ncbi:MAG: PadR family transcriptional regulator, partial [Bryobacteraceae bacterium]